jgi:glycosyltransferase involved in cell wall biosynthesis
MKIAINARFSGYANAEGYARFTRGVITPMVRDFSGDDYIFLFDKKSSGPVISSGNTSFLSAGPEARHPLLWKYWYDWVLPKMVRKVNADCLFSPDGFCSLNCTIPQVLAIHDLAFLHYPHGISRLYLEYYKYYTPKFIARARQIVTVSEFSRADIINHYPEARHKISVVYNAADETFLPLDYTEKEKCREKMTGGREFFLYAGSIHPRKNIVTLLKGFSWFKKRHQSNMKLVLAGRMAWKNESFLEQLETYKYRDDVIVTGYLPDDELKLLMASAYALAYPSFWEGFGLPVLEAMQCGVPVIAANNSAIPEIAGGAAFYAEPGDAEAWGRGMGLVYKDETYRNKLIQNGLERASFFSWEKSAKALHEVFVKAVS